MSDFMEITFDAVRPDASRAWYRHCYGLRGSTWSVHGYFERVYYFAPDYVDGPLRPHLENTIVSLWAVIKSELDAAIAEGMRPDLEATVNAFLRRSGSASAPAAEDVDAS